MEIFLAFRHGCIFQGTVLVAIAGNDFPCPFASRYDVSYHKVKRRRGLLSIHSRFGHISIQIYIYNERSSGTVGGYDFILFSLLIYCIMLYDIHSLFIKQRLHDLKNIYYVYTKLYKAFSRFF